MPLNLRRAHRWITGSLGAAVFAATTVAVLHPDRVIGIDGTGRIWGLDHHEATAVTVAKLFSKLGDPWVAGIVTAAGAAVAVAVTRSPRPLLVGAGLLAATAGVTAGVKDWVGRVGPSFLPWPMVHVGGQAYPSGHELLVVVSWGFIAGVVSEIWPRAGRTAWAVMLIACASAGVSYVYGPAHWITDVVGSIGLGTLLLAVCPPAVRRQTEVSVGSHRGVRAR